MSKTKTEAVAERPGVEQAPASELKKPKAMTVNLVKPGEQFELEGVLYRMDSQDRIGGQVICNVSHDKQSFKLDANTIVTKK